MARHFQMFGVLLDTFKHAGNKLVIPMFFLFLFLLIFSLFVYEFEQGEECFVGEYCRQDSHSEPIDWEDFAWPNDETPWPKNTRILIDENGEATSFSNAFYSMWLSLVTMTSVGYGGISPITFVGQLVGLIMMLFGTFYLAMPLTIVGGTFYTSYRMQVAAESVYV